VLRNNNVAKGLFYSAASENSYLSVTLCYFLECEGALFGSATTNLFVFFFECYFVATQVTTVFTSCAVSFTNNILGYKNTVTLTITISGICHQLSWQSTHIFTYSQNFPGTDKIRKTSAISGSNGVIGSQKLSATAPLSGSSTLSNTEKFLSSEELPVTHDLLWTNQIGPTDLFTESESHDKTNAHDQSNFITKSYHFSETKGNSESDRFGKTNGFSQTPLLRSTSHLAKSEILKDTNSLSKTPSLAKTQFFSETSKFSLPPSPTPIATIAAPSTVIPLATEVDSGESHPSTYSPIQTRTALPPPASASVPVLLPIDSIETSTSLLDSTKTRSHKSSGMRDTSEILSEEHLSNLPAAAQEKPSENTALLVVSIILMLAMSVIFAILMYTEDNHFKKLMEMRLKKMVDPKGKK
jgi:hypothetical protein